MTKRKRVSVIVLALLTLTLLLPVQAFAAVRVDTGRDVSLTIHDRYESEGLEAVTFDLYLIASMDAYGELSPTEEFMSYAEALDIRGENDEAWKETAEALERDILLGNLGELTPVDSAVTDKDGTAAFPSGAVRLTPGLYLVMGSHTEKENQVYSTAPFFVSLPGRNTVENEWDYDVEANAKPGVQPVLADLRVEKIWQDDCHVSQRPETISIQLVCDGQPYGDPVTLPENGRWEHTWENLEMNHDWTVTEKQAEGYAEPDVRRDGNTFLVTNTCRKPSSSGSTLPQTGQLWWPVPVLAALGLLALLIGLLRRRGNAHEA